MANSNTESAPERGQAVAIPSGDVVWNDALNERRFALIDKEIQKTLTPTERGELDRLTTMMRNQIDSEMNVPMKGARTLHQMLLQLKPTEAFD